MEGIHGVDVSWLHHSPKGIQLSFSLASTERWKLDDAELGVAAKLDSYFANDYEQTTIQKPARPPLQPRMTNLSYTSRMRPKVKTNQLRPKPMDPILQIPKVMRICLISFTVRTQRKSTLVLTLPRIRKTLKHPPWVDGIRGCQA